MLIDARGAQRGSEWGPESSAYLLMLARAHELAAIVESSEDAIYSVDLDDVVTTWNAGAERLFGYLEGEIIGRTASVLLPAGHEAEMNRCIAGVKSGERLERFDTVRARKDGGLVDVAVVISPIYDDAGTVVAVSVIARDISRRIASERALRSSLAELHHVNSELQRTTRSLRTLSACMQALVHATDESQLLQAVCDVAISEGGYRMALVGYCEHDDERTVSPVATAGWPEGHVEKLRLSWGEGPFAQGPMGQAIRCNRAAVVSDVETEPTFVPWREATLERGVRSAVGLPLTGDEGRPFGGIVIYAAEVDAFDDEEVRLLEQLAVDLSYGVSSLRNKVKREAAEELVREMAYVDALTGLPNRRLLDDRAAMALAHARRSDGSVAAVFVDVDCLKGVNDSLGHACGDEVIRQTGQRLTGVLRDGDTVARLGGDEFVVVLLDCDEPAAEVIGERILESLSEPMTVEGHRVRMTASVGIAVDRGGTIKADRLIRHADKAMYAIKRAGGNGLGKYAAA